jgi:hypothetical protein
MNTQNKCHKLNNNLQSNSINQIARNIDTQRIDMYISSDENEMETIKFKTHSCCLGV